MHLAALHMRPSAPPSTKAAHGSPVAVPALLAWSFALFNSLRIVAYLPTLLAIGHSGHAEEHSLLTWLVFLGSNATMALWLREHNGRRANRAVVVCAVNALMCAAICALIVWLRLPGLAAWLQA